MAQRKPAAPIVQPAMYSMLFGAVNCTFPWWKTQVTTLNLPWFSMDIETPGFFMSALFYLGLASLSFMTARFVGRHVKSFYNYLRSFQNSKRFLNSLAPNQATYSAVIYGASTKVGKAYARYLA